MFDNPIFKREFSVAAKSGMYNFLVWAYLILLAGLLLVLWPRDGVLSAVSDSGKQIFSLFFSINLTLLILLTPAFTAASITFEKENNTFDALFNTLLTPFEIIAGKLAASLAKLLVVVLLTTPIAAVCALTGGISFLFLLKATALLAAAAVTYGLIGMAISASVRRSYTAILANYAAILLLAGATWLPAVLLGNLVGMQSLWQMVRSVSPYDALFYLLYPTAYGLTSGVEMGGSAGMLNPYTVFLLSCVVVSAISVGIFCARAAKPTAERARQLGDVFADQSTAVRRKLSWPFYIIDPLKRKKPIGRFSNPVFVAEIRGKLFANPKFVVRTVSAIFVASLVMLFLIALQFGETFTPDTVRVVAVIFQIAVVGLLAPGVSSGLITDERTAGTFQALRLTPMTPLTIVLGKLKATFFYALIFIISSFFVLLSMAYMEDQTLFPEHPMASGAFWAKLSAKACQAAWWGDFWATYWGIVVWSLILVLSAVTFLSAGLFASAISRTTGTATAVSYTIIAGLCIVTLAPLVLGDRLSSGASTVLLSFNPIAAAIQATSDSLPGYPRLWAANILALIGLTTAFLMASTARIWWLFHKAD